MNNIIKIKEVNSPRTHKILIMYAPKTELHDTRNKKLIQVKEKNRQLHNCCWRLPHYSISNRQNK